MPQDENYNSPKSKKSRPLKFSLKTVNYILLAISLAVTIRFSLSVVLNPLNGPRFGSFIPMMFAIAIFIACSFAILKQYIQERKYRNLASIIQGFFMLVLPIMVMANLNKVADRKGVSLISQSMVPLIKALDHYTAKNLHPPLDITDMLAHIEYGRPVSYYYGKKEYLIACRGGSIDIDGTTIFYSSENKKWNLVHNDELLEKTPMGRSAKLYTAIINSMFGNGYNLNSQTEKWEKSDNG